MSNQNSNSNDVRKMTMFMVVAFGLVACVLYGVGGGIRGNIGLLLNPLAEQCGIEYEDVSFCIAIMQFVFGATQPIFGIIASKKSNRFVLFLGSILMSASVIGMMMARSYIVLFISLGILFGAGAGAFAFGLILTSAIYFVGKEHSMMIAGMLNASAGVGLFIFAPIIQNMLDKGGLRSALGFIIIPVIALIPISIFVTSRDPKKSKNGSAEGNDETTSSEPKLSTVQLFKKAFSNRTYRLLVAGFSTCGFHMIIIESHLYSQYVSYGIEPKAASWVFSVYGIVTIAGALLSGFLSARINKGKLLSFYYGFRAVWVLIYLFLMPKNVVTAFLFSSGLGLTGDATVSPTSGLVSDNFKVSEVATLVGFLFLCHQIGAFFSAWLGGVIFSSTGSYNMIWLIDVALCAFASVMSFMIRKKEEHCMHMD